MNEETSYIICQVKMYHVIPENKIFCNLKRLKPLRGTVIVAVRSN